jgi:hypothetical protein
MAEQLQYEDLDVYGRIDFNGQITVHKNNFALANAIIIFLTTVQGDFLLNPSKGGVLARLEMKLQNTSETAIAQYITQAVLEEFSHIITSVQTSVSYLRDERTLVIQMVFISKLDSEPQGLKFQVKTSSDYLVENRTTSFYPIQFTGENLYNFIVSQSIYFPNKTLQFINGEWTWAIYSFPNLTEEDEYFNMIKEVLK